MSDKNVPSVHMTTAMQYKKLADPLIKGRFVWDKKPANMLWVKKIIDLKEFE